LFIEKCDSKQSKSDVKEKLSDLVANKQYGLLQKTRNRAVSFFKEAFQARMEVF
jgi:hypothetical protein